MRSTFTHPRVWISAALILLVAAWFVSRPIAPPAAKLPAPPVQSAPAAPPTNIVSDPAAVFQRAFWKRPAAADKILHAERREWADQDGVQKWSWFIAVEPSPELVQHLRVDNAFNLVPSASLPSMERPPEWFVVNAGAFEAMHASQGGMWLFFSKTGNLLYATDTGGGFNRGAPEAPKPLPATPAAGRLPLTPPPSIP